MPRPVTSAARESLGRSPHGCYERRLKFALPRTLSDCLCELSRVSHTFEQRPTAVASGYGVLADLDLNGVVTGRGESDALREASDALSTAIRWSGWGAVMAGKCLEGGALNALAVASHVG